MGGHARIFLNAIIEQKPGDSPEGALSVNTQVSPAEDARTPSRSHPGKTPPRQSIYQSMMASKSQQ